jgi:hypothetical protein
LTIENATEPQGKIVEGPDWLTQPTLDGLIQDPSKIESLPPDQKKDFHDFMDRNLGGKPAPAPAPSPAAAPGAPAPASDPAAAAAPTPDGVKSPDDIPAKRPQDRQKFFEKYNTMATDLNTSKQLLEKANRATEALQARLLELQKKPVTQANPDDAFDPNSLKNLVERLQKSEETVKALTEHVQATNGLMASEYQTRTDSLQEDATALSLERFQLETADGERIPDALALKTTVPFGELKREIEQFAQDLGGLDKVNMYLSDPAFKARAEAAGHKLSEGFIKNLPVYNEIWAINKEVVEGRQADHMTAYVSRLIKGGKLREWQQAAKLEGATAVATAISNRNNNTPLLNPNEGPRPTLGGWTKESAMQWYQDHPDIKPGSADATTKAQISELLRTGQLR